MSVTIGTTDTQFEAGVTALAAGLQADETAIITSLGDQPSPTAMLTAQFDMGMLTSAFTSLSGSVKNHTDSAATAAQNTKAA